MNYNSKLKEMTTKKNYEGAKAYAMTPELELYTAVVTASLSDTFYEKQNERTDRIAPPCGHSHEAPKVHVRVLSP